MLHALVLGAMAKNDQHQSQGERLRKARMDAGFKSASEAARRFGWLPSTYLAHENGQNGLKPDVAITYAEKFGIDPGWLLTGNIKTVDGGIVTTTNADESHGRIAADASREPQPGVNSDINVGLMPRDMPVIGSARCGEDGLFELNGQTLDYVRRPPRLSGITDAYALYVDGDSMAPWREHGDVVYVHPHQPAKINDYVVVQLKAARPGDPQPAYIKRLLRQTPAELRLLQFNPRKEISIKASRVATIHKIVDWSELMGI